MITSSLAWFFACGLVLSPTGMNDPDADGDGLSDFHETHKYGTDPRKADSDGDGIGDGGWFERREYAYTVRSVVQVMKPVTLEHLTDDFQDARLLDEGVDWVELEVIHYPFRTANETIEGSNAWRRTPRELKRWIEPGPTSDWTPKLRKRLLKALKEDGIDVAALDDKRVVERVSAWLMDYAEYHDGFSSFITSFDELGRPYIDDELSEQAERGRSKRGLSQGEVWAREISARGMFENRVHGSCTSSAIYLSGCLRAVGIPTRTVLCIPLVDAGDERERAMVHAGLEHNSVRQIVANAVRRGISAWTSHTFNEVWVGGRWRRLNYQKLGQGILDAQYLGLMTHVATFHDWADARMSETVGRRHRTRTQKELFGGSNPYSTVSLRDRFGEHCTLENPPAEEERLSVEALLWTDDKDLPQDIVAGCKKSSRFGLIAVVVNVESFEFMKNFLSRADLRVWLESQEHPRLGVGFDPGCWWFKNGTVFIYLPFGAVDRCDFLKGVDYTAVARNEAEGPRWDLALAVRR